MNITYTALCPTCQAGGVSARLKRDIQEPEVIFCDNKHKFSSDDIAEYLNSDKAPSTVAPPDTPAPAVEEVQKGFQEAAEKAFEDYQMAPPPVLTPPSSPSPSADPMELRRAPTAVAVVEAPAPARRSEPLPVQEPGSPRKPVRELPGGNLEITVTIPDPHANYLKAEAEFRGKTVQEHFEEIMMSGMEGRWWY